MAAKNEKERQDSLAKEIKQNYGLRSWPGLVEFSGFL